MPTVYAYLWVLSLYYARFNNKSSRQLSAYILEKAGVALLDGTSFGGFGEGFLRISYTASLSNLEKGICRMNKALKGLL